MLSSKAYLEWSLLNGLCLILILQNQWFAEFQNDLLCTSMIPCKNSLFAGILIPNALYLEPEFCVLSKHRFRHHFSLILNFIFGIILFFFFYDPLGYFSCLQEFYFNIIIFISLTLLLYRDSISREHHIKVNVDRRVELNELW